MTKAWKARQRKRADRHHALRGKVKPGPDGRCYVTGKYAYASRSVARQHVRQAKQQADHPPGLQTYHCHSCGAWHVGHKP